MISTGLGSNGFRILLIVAALSPCGCSRGPKIAKVSGKVTFRGELVTTGTITFYPETGRPAIGQIGPDGTYTLTTNKEGDGAFVGKHRVTIHANKVGAGSIAEVKSFEDEQKLTRSEKILIPGKITWIVPEMYSREDSSTLTATVNESNNTIDFNLTE